MIKMLTLKTRVALNAEIPSATKISIWHNRVVLWNSHTVKQSKWWFCLIEIKHYSSRGPIALWLCTGVETVKQSLNSVETNKELFHSFNAHHHNAMFGIKNASEVQGQHVNLALN